MKKNKIAFTMVELIVVTVIMILLTTSSVFYFFDFTDNRELIIQVDILQDDIDDLNKQVQRFNISDYELYFEAGLEYYTGSINNLGTQSSIILSIDEATGEGSFEIEGGGSNLVWNYEIYENEKEVFSKITAANLQQEYSFDFIKNYRVSGYVDGEATNSIIVKRLTTLDSGVDLLSPVSATYSNKNNIKTPATLSLEFAKGSATYNLELK
ncbi:type II secretion system GspH family protein [Candidatus Gracilibacteria bacterium]|nr:type II secretion system GspH family protein [Candidatus Gracilibacteria bacterium]